jgi:hypothetical protein
LLPRPADRSAVPHRGSRVELRQPWRPSRPLPAVAPTRGLRGRPDPGRRNAPARQAARERRAARRRRTPAPLRPTPRHRVGPENPPPKVCVRQAYFR